MNNQHRNRTINSGPSIHTFHQFSRRPTHFGSMSSTSLRTENSSYGGNSAFTDLDAGLTGSRLALVSDPAPELGESIGPELGKSIDPDFGNSIDPEFVNLSDPELGIIPGDNADELHHMSQNILLSTDSSRHTQKSGSEIPPEKSKDTLSTQSVSLSTAGVRAFIFQLQALYLRTPIKLFRPSRFDYMVYVREQANKHYNIASKPYRFHTHSGIAMLFSVVKREGWRFIPDHVLPPLLANSATGLILYGTYLTALDSFNGDKQQGPNFQYSPIDTWRAGFLAGAIQSLAAAPIDAIYSRLTLAEMLSGKHQNLWSYGAYKLREIGLVGVFGGYGFAFVKESLGFAFYFSTFELVKTRGYSLTYKMIAAYRRVKLGMKNTFSSIFANSPKVNPDILQFEQYRLTKLLKSTFILLAGASAAFSLLAVQYPLSKVQQTHLSRLEALDIYNATKFPDGKRPLFKRYYHSYIDTYNQIRGYKHKANTTWFKYAYKGFARNALTTIPATSIGLLVFEIMRTRLADNIDELALQS